MHKRGFTLVELIVALGLFGLILIMAISALLNLSKNNKFAQNSREALDNLDFVMDDIVREARFGTNYHCDISVGALDTPLDCNTTAKAYATSFSLTRLKTNEVVKYAMATIGGKSGITKQIISSTGVAGAIQTMTSDNVNVELLKFMVTGSPQEDLEQARVLIALRALAKEGKVSSKVNLQTTVTQRATDS